VRTCPIAAAIGQVRMDFCFILRRMPKRFFCKIAFLFILVCCGGRIDLIAQEPLNWLTLNARLNLSPNVRVFGETQLRSAAFLQNFNYTELKGGGSYHIGPNFNLLLGGGRYNTWQETGNFVSPRSQAEWRMWVEATMGQFVGKFRFEHRYRIEQRWLIQGTRNRFRYRIGMIFPLNRRRIESQTLFLNAFNEIFLGPTAPFFERNRFVFGGGYRFTRLSIQANYLRQFDYSLAGSRTRNYFQLNFLIDLPGKSGGNKSLPLPED
jgi:hypothetical protein